MKNSQWTPEKIIQGFKELVTAVMGLVILIYTIVLAVKVFDYVGDQQKISDAKDILLLMLGITGIVIGYYFGRVPADARATQAQEQANNATAQSEQVSTQSKLAENQIDEIVARMTASSEAGSREIAAVAGTENVLDDLKRVRDTLRQVISTTR
jgi:hypothetical protein